MCVPVCDPREGCEMVLPSPRSISWTRSIATGGLSGQCIMAWRNGIETSIHDFITHIILHIAALLPAPSAGYNLACVDCFVG